MHLPSWEHIKSVNCNGKDFGKLYINMQSFFSSENLTLPQNRLGKRHHPINNIGNKNAERKHRRLELGWMNMTQQNTYKQVRTKSGGGTRNLTVEKSITTTDLLDVAKATFFPEGKSKMGRCEDFVFEMRDFKGDSIPSSKSVEELYKDTHLKTLRIYIHTRPRIDPQPDEESGVNEDGFITETSVLVPQPGSRDLTIEPSRIPSVGEPLPGLSLPPPVPEV